MKVFLVLAALMVASNAMDVLELGDSDFDSTLEQHETALVMFYAPWCGHCKRMKPEFDKAATLLKANDPPVTLAKVDCTEAGKDTCSRFEVRGYPTVKIFRDGELSQDYSGPREAPGIVKFMKSQVGPASKQCDTQSDCDALLAKDEVVVMGVFDNDGDMDVFKKVASAMREEVAFGHSDKALEGKKGIVLYRPKHLQSKFEPASLTYDGEMDKAEITGWISSNYHGLVGHRTLDNAKDFKEPLVIVYYDVDYVKNVKGTNYWRNRVMKVATKYQENGLRFAVANRDDFAKEAEDFGFGGAPSDGKPVVAIKASKKYVMSDEFSVDNLDKFVQAYLNKEIEPYMKSEDVPASNDGPVKVAVAKNFDELVTNNEKDVLVEFYAPWCGHCKQLAPVYDELGEKMAGESVDIVKIDATANDVPSEFQVRGFPTIFWVPAEDKTPVQYNGGREVDDFVKYIASKATKELNGFTRDGKPKKEEL